MHEASIVSGILRIAIEEAQKHGAAAITRVRLETGLLAGVEHETLTACFELMAEGTMAEGAELETRSAPLDCRCGECGHAFTLESRLFRCPACGGIRLEFEGGHGCRIMGIEVESPDET